MFIHEMLISASRFTGRTMIQVMVVNTLKCDELVVSRSWVDRNTGRVKEIMQVFEYKLGELFKGAVSVDLGRDCVLNLKNGQVESLENPNGVQFGMSS